MSFISYSDSGPARGHSLGCQEICTLVFVPVVQPIPSPTPLTPLAQPAVPTLENAWATIKRLDWPLLSNQIVTEDKLAAAVAAAESFQLLYRQVRGEHELFRQIPKNNLLLIIALGYDTVCVIKEDPSMYDFILTELQEVNLCVDL
jgi:hypothetical protein